MKSMSQKVILSCVVTISFVAYSAQEFERKLVPGQEIGENLPREHDREIKAQEELNQARLEALRERLTAEGKSEQEILAQHGQAQRAEVEEFLSSDMGDGEDQAWTRSSRFVFGVARSENREQADAVSGSDRVSEIGSEDDGEDEECWDSYFLAASIVHTHSANTEQVGDL